jgi:hypothetical protein
MADGPSPNSIFVGVKIVSCGQHSTMDILLPFDFYCSLCFQNQVQLFVPLTINISD